MNTTAQKPKHIAIICDGNRRWAKSRKLATFMGHDYAVNNTIEELIDASLSEGIKYITFWVFSTENWDREAKEIEWLMNLFRKLFDEKIEKYNQKGVRVVHIGNVDGLAEDIQKKITEGTEKTKHNEKMTVVIAMNYGGRDEIIRANKKMYDAIKKGEFKIEDLNEKSFVQFLDTKDIPDPDLIIRTSGEQRLSGFLLWQQQYSEFYFSNIEFPDFKTDELKKAIFEFSQRDRRYGGNSKK